MSDQERVILRGCTLWFIIGTVLLLVLIVGIIIGMVIGRAG